MIRSRSCNSPQVDHTIYLQLYFIRRDSQIIICKFKTAKLSSKPDQMLVSPLLCCVVLVSWVMFFWLCESWLKGTPREIWYRDEFPQQKWPTASVPQSFNGNTGPIHLARHSQEVQMNKRANKQPLSRLWARAALTTRSWNFLTPQREAASKCWRTDRRDPYTTVSPWAAVLFRLRDPE